MGADEDFAAAVRLHQQNRLPEAEARYRAVLKATPTHAGALHRLALLCLQAGHMAEAEPLLRQAASAAPQDALVHHHFGLLLLRLGQPTQAAAESRAALAIKPDFAEALANLGAAYGALGALGQALEVLQQALRLRPDDPDIWNALGEVQARSGAYEVALVSFTKVLARRPKAVTTLLGRAEALAALDRQDEALAAAETAVAADPHYAAAHHVCGTLLKQLGRFAEAEAAFARAVALAPDAAAFHRALGETRKYTTGDTRLAGLEALLQKPLPARQQVELHFALFKAYDDLGRHEEAFAELARGNAIYRSLIPYDETAVLAKLRTREESFSPERMAAAHGFVSDLPVFIVGMPRSGTSLVEQILASHPEVHGAGELTLLGGLIAEILPEYPVRVPQDAIWEIGRRYVDAIRAKAPGAHRITDKLPANFRHLGLIQLALPGARILHVQRDARDTCFSCYSKLFRPGLNFAYDLAELGRYYRAYERLMTHWRAVLPPILDVRYETLVNDFEAEARRIVAFCGLPWDESCLRFHETQRAVRTLSEFQVRRPLFTDSIGRWRTYEKWLGPLLAEIS